MSGQHHALAAFTPGKDPVPIVQKAGWAPELVWTGVENLAPPGFDSRTVQPVGSRYTDYATRPSTEMSTRNISLGAGAYGWQPHHLHVPIVMESGSLNLLEHSGPVQACNGTALYLSLMSWPVRTKSTRNRNISEFRISEEGLGSVTSVQILHATIQQNNNHVLFNLEFHSSDVYFSHIKPAVPALYKSAVPSYMLLYSCVLYFSYHYKL